MALFRLINPCLESVNLLLEEKKKNQDSDCHKVMKILNSFSALCLPTSDHGSSAICCPGFLMISLKHCINRQSPFFHSSHYVLLKETSLNVLPHVSNESLASIVLPLGMT